MIEWHPARRECPTGTTRPPKTRKAVPTALHQPAANRGAVKEIEVDLMATIEIELPDELAQRAKSAGLLSDSAIQGLLEDAIRRQSGRMLLDVARGIHAANIPDMSDEDVVAEVKAVRAERRARGAGETLSPGNGPEDDAGRA
jgi:hypothetical protein